MNYLNETGLSYFWGKIKQHVTRSVDDAVSEVGSYTINGYEINTNPVLNKADIGLGNVTNDAQVKRTEMGAANGVATLGSDSKIPAAQLPSYVDDVLEYDNKSAFPETGEAGKIYVAKDTNLTYRWSGSAYVEVSQSLALGETSSTAYAGDKGKANRDAINSLPATLISSVSRGTVGANTITINVNKATKSGINYGSPAAANFDLPAATTTAAGLMSSSDKKLVDDLGTTFDTGIVIPGVTSSPDEEYIEVAYKYVFLNDGTYKTQSDTWNIPNATSTKAGVMTAAMFNKLNEIGSISNQTIDELCV